MASGTEKEDLIQEQVIRAAQQLYQQYGLHKVTMEDVAKAVGKGKSSLYYYYKSKEEIFDAVIDVEIREILAEISRAVGKVDTLEEKIHAFCLSKLKISKKRRSTFNVMDMSMNADEMTSYTKARHAVHIRFRERETAFFKQLLMEGNERGEIRKMGEKEMDMVVFVILSSFRGLKREVIEENSNKQEEAAARTIAALMMNGLKR
jgi:AcrR family transcriptional regulator